MTDTTRTLESNHAMPLAFDDRTRRVMEIRKQVREGTYRPDAEEIAKALLREWSTIGELVGRERTASAIHTPEGRREFSTRFTVERTPLTAVESTAASA